MPWFLKTLRFKLMAGSLVAIAGLVVLPIVYSWSADRQSRAFADMTHTEEVILQAQGVQSILRDLVIDELGYAAMTEPRFREKFDRDRRRLKDHLGQLGRLVGDNPQQIARSQRLVEQINAWLDTSPVDSDTEPPPRSLLPALAEGNHAGAKIQDIENVLSEFTGQEGVLLQDRHRADTSARTRNLAVVLTGSGLAIVAILVMTAWLTRSLATPIRELTEATEQMQQGDLGARVTPRGHDELGRLGRAFNAMAEAQQRNARTLETRDIQAGVLQVAEVLATAEALAELLDQALERILQVSGCPAGALYLRSPGDEILRVLASSGAGPGLADQAFRPGEGIIGRVARSRIAYFTLGDSEAAPFTIHHWLGQQRAAEMAYLPLTAGPELVGVLALAAAEPIDDRMRNLLTIVSGQLGAAIQNALSHQTLQRQAAELEARNERLAQQQTEIERQNVELRVASQLKSEFLATMSHELRTPLTIILGFTNTVLRGTQGELNPDQAGSLRRVYDNARQLLNLINDILDLSKIEAGQMEVDFEPVHLAALVENVTDGFRDLAASKGLDLRAEIDARLPGEVPGDETRLRQIITNLISNAVKFTERGEVIVSARWPGGESYEIEVRDTGPGIAEADVPTIFERFRQLDGRTTRKAGGTGLGLSIVKRLVGLLGGSIEVRSRVGVGTSFLVRLPLQPDPGTGRADRQPMSRRPPPTDIAETPGRIVLAIDDDEDFLALLRSALQETPFHLRTASNGREGLDLAERLRPDAITLDVMMPELDGWHVLGALKSNPATAEIPVILMSVLQRRGLGLMLGAADYLTKPLDRDRLLRTLKRLRRPEPGPILIVDDEPGIREMLAMELRSEGFDWIETAADGVEGLRKARAEPPALVVLDLMMPRMDGFEMAARLQEDEATRSVPILVLTSKELSAGEIRRLNGQIEDVIQKGALDLDALVARLITILRSIGVRPT